MYNFDALPTAKVSSPQAKNPVWNPALYL